MISADHPCFKGHFPGHPVFPAVAQMDLLLDLLQKHWQRNLHFAEIRKAKFPAPIAPGCRLHVSFKIEGQTVFWQVFDNEKIYSCGTILVAFD